MEQDRFDELAKKVFSGSSRRRVVGGALASVVGAGIAAVTGTSAKNAKGKAKKGKGKAKGEFVCTAANANQQLCTDIACAADADCTAAGCFNNCDVVGGFCIGPDFVDGTAGNACPPNTCCQSTPAGNGPACVGSDLQAGTQICGNPPFGEGVCRTCPTGTRCSGFPNFACVCDPTTCSDGCCIPGGAVSGIDDDICIRNGSGEPVNSDDPFFNGSFVCGTGGSICNVCSTGGGVFSGCCTAQGQCVAGTANANCGSSGQICEVCQNDSSCGEDQACTGGTTTTTTTVSPTTTLAPCGTTGKGKPKVRCGTACCKKCNGAGTGCKKKHHHHKH